MAGLMRRAKAAGIVAAVAVTLVVSGGPALARTIDCAFDDRACFGTKQADTITGEGQNIIDGKGGNDRITSLGGSSDIIGGAGSDRITDEKGASDIEGGAGDDTIVSKGGASNLTGGSGDDEIRALRGLNDIKGNGGDDVINAKNGEGDDVDCGTGKDKVIFDAGLDELTGCEIKRS